MQIRLDAPRCTGHARCSAMAPDLFPLDEDGYSAISTLDVAVADQERAEIAVQNCPESALVIESA